MADRRRSPASRARCTWISTRSSSAPASPAFTSSTGCANSASRRGYSKPAPASAAPGIGTAIPGARFDSESWTYGYSFSQELLDEWDWEEHFAGQPETERYLNYVADKFDLRRDIQFKSRVKAAHYREDTRSWDVALEDGRRTRRASWSPRSACCRRRRCRPSRGGDIPGPVLPHPLLAEGTGDIRGQAGRGDRHRRDRHQTITEVAKTAGHLTVFQRTPQWSAPLHNAKITKEEMHRIRANYSEIFARCQETYGCFIHAADPRAALEVTEEEREAFWEKLYGEPGFGIWMGNFRDILVDRQANALISDFVARKIRQRVKDPGVAEKLIPKNHGFGTRRVPLESGYFEVYNQPNVKLVDSTRRRSSASPRPASRPATPNTNSTSSSTPPASTRSPAPSTASTSAGSTGCR